jgi:hypothetical protein
VPKAFAEELGASVDKAANMEVRDGKLVIEIAKPNRRFPTRHENEVTK